MMTDLNQIWVCTDCQYTTPKNEEKCSQCGGVMEELGDEGCDLVPPSIVLPLQSTTRH